MPADFHFCSKVWEELTVPTYADLPRYGAKAGEPNPRFLDSNLFREMVLQPFLNALPGRIGPFIFEFQRTGMDPGSFLEALDCFLPNLPVGFPYAVEIRNPAVLSPQYRAILLAHNVAHTYNHWTGMPPLLAQHRLLNERFTAPICGHASAHAARSPLRRRRERYMLPTIASSHRSRRCAGKLLR